MEFENPKLFISGISSEITETTLKQHFSEYGEVKDVLVIVHKRIGFVTFTDPSMAQNALQKEHIILGQKVEVEPAEPKVQISNRKIFVGGLPHTITLEELKQYFGQYGRITDAVVIYNKETNRSRGFGFVTYDSEEAAKRVLRNNFHDLNNKRVEVKWATPKEEMRCDHPYGSVYDVYSQPHFNPSLSFGTSYQVWVPSYGFYASYQPLPCDHPFSCDDPYCDHPYFNNWMYF